VTLKRILPITILALSLVSYAHALPVAILSATGNPAADLDIKNKILANAPFMDVDILRVDTSTPSLAMMSTYKALLVIGDDPFFSRTTLSNNLAAYLDAGGGIVMAALSNVTASRILGSFDVLSYWALTPALMNSGTQLTLGTVYVPGSPLMTGVTSFDGGTLSLNVGGSVKPGAVRIADWSNGTPLVVEWAPPGKGKEVALNFYPASSDVNSGFWNSSTNGGRLLANALSEVGGADPVSAPEPWSMLLTGAGLILIGLLRKRDRQAGR